MTKRRFAALLAFFTAIAVAPAMAHPHVWVEMRSDVVFNDQGQISAVNLMGPSTTPTRRWRSTGSTPMATASTTRPSSSHSPRKTSSRLKDYDYFTAMRFNGQKQPVGEVKEAGPDLFQRQAAASPAGAAEDAGGPHQGRGRGAEGL